MLQEERTDVPKASFPRIAPGRPPGGTRPERPPPPGGRPPPATPPPSPPGTPGGPGEEGAGWRVQDDGHQLLPREGRHGRTHHLSQRAGGCVFCGARSFSRGCCARNAGPSARIGGAPNSSSKPIPTQPTSSNFWQQVEKIYYAESDGSFQGSDTSLRSAGSCSHVESIAPGLRPLVSPPPPSPRRPTRAPARPRA
jgi:hypothetical protein